MRPKPPTPPQNRPAVGAAEAPQARVARALPGDRRASNARRNGTDVGHMGHASRGAITPLPLTQIAVPIELKAQPKEAQGNALGLHAHASFVLRGLKARPIHSMQPVPRPTDHSADPGKMVAQRSEPRTGQMGQSPQVGSAQRAPMKKPKPPKAGESLSHDDAKPGEIRPELATERAAKHEFP